MELNGSMLEETSCQIDDAQINFYDSYAWWIKGVFSVSIAILGIIFNSIAIFILGHKQMRESFFNRLLISLTLVDSLFLANGIYVSLVLQLSEPTSQSLQYIFVKILYPTRNILMCSSIYMTVGLSYERYNAIVRPYLQLVRRKKNNIYRLLLYITPVITFSILFYSPKFLELKLVDNVLECSQGNSNKTSIANWKPIFHICPTDLRNNKVYILWYLNVFNLIVTSIIPGVLLTFYNFRIYSACKERNLKRANVFSKVSQGGVDVFSNNDTKGDDMRQSFVLFAIVGMFFICHSLRIALNIAELVGYEMKQEQWINGCPGIRFWGLIALPISGLMLLINSSTDFFIYCIYDPIFRNILNSYVPTKRRSNYVPGVVTMEEKIEMKNMI